MNDQREDLYAAKSFNYSPDYMYGTTVVFNAQDEIQKLNKRISDLEATIIREIRNTPMRAR